jgi:acyl transferase domain-containing protein/phosphopantetheinyl transferase/aryl carrier-like protein
MTGGARRTDAAIVGMACLLPGAADVTTYWRNIIGKVDAVSEPPDDWGADSVFDPASDENDRVYCKRGGYLGPLAEFDPLRYGVMPRSVDGGEPDQYLALRVAHDAMEDAGYLVRDFDHDRAEVVIGRGTYINRGFTNVVQHGLAVDQALAILRRLHPEHSEQELAELKRELKRSLPPFNSDMAPGLVPNVMSGRIANRFDLRGANYTIDAACASSLVALDRAMQDLRAGRCDLALVGGVHCSTPSPILMIFCQLGALSRSGTMRPFDRRADGTLLGEGSGFVVLRRLADAERDGDRIYAVVRGVGTASDGRGLGMLAPRVEGEVLALRRAYEEAAVSPRTVGLLEAHGTGTPVGDAAEIAALAEVFGEREGELPSCAVGCVKSMISHLIPAAGIAGLIKVALALHHKVLPPTLHCEEPNPALGIERTPLYLNTEARPWIHGGPAPRRAAVDAFGFGGINTHAVVEEVPAHHDTPVQPDPVDWDVEVLVLEAESRQELVARAEKARQFLTQAPDVPLRDVASSLCVSTVPEAGERLAIVATTPDEAATRLATAIERLRDPGYTRLRDATGLFYDEQPLGRQPGALAFVFPGEGSQYPGMLTEACLHFAEARECFDAIDRTFAGHREGSPPSAYVFPPPGSEEGTATERLMRMDGAGESLFAANQAMFAVLTGLGLVPDALVGHSSGEYTALLGAGALAFDDEAQLAASTRAIHELYRSAEGDRQIGRASLVAVASVDEGMVAAIVEAAPDDLYVAMDNCPRQMVLCGSRAATDWATARLREAGGVCTDLPFDRPYHTPLFTPFTQALEGHFAGLPFVPPRVPLWSCASAARFSDDPDEVRHLALAQWSMPVRFRETIEAMYEDGVRVFVECGPRGNLTAFVDDTLRGRPHLAVATDAGAHHGMRRLAMCLAQLAAHGVSIDFARLYARRGACPVDLRAPARSAPPASQRLPTALPALRLERIPAQPAGDGRRNGGPPQSAPATDSLLEAHFATIERIVDAHRNVMEAFLHGAGPPPGSTIALPPAPPIADVPVEDDGHDERSTAVVPDSDAPGASNGASNGASLDPSGPPDRHAVEAALRALISERTGYPPSAIASDLNLEADLGVDSIKRVEILETYRAQAGAAGGLDLDRLAQRRTLYELAEAIAGAGETSATLTVPSSPDRDGSPVAGPLITSISAITPGATAIVTCELDLEEHLFLLDHTLESQPVSAEDVSLVGLPIMPLTFSMELLAEAAAVLRPGDCVVGMRDVRATRWITVPGVRLVLDVHARAENDHDVRVELYERAGGDAPVVTAVVELAAEPLTAPGPTSGWPEGEPTSRENDAALYGGLAMFHGPAFQAVKSIDRSGADAMQATLAAPPAALLVRSLPEPAFLLEPVLLDAMGQVVAYWVADRHDHAVNIFPFRLAQLRVYGLQAPDGALTCRVRVHRVDEQALRSDVELVGPDGAVVAAMTGWEDRRMDLPTIVRDFLASPRDAMLSRPWSVSGRDGQLVSEGWRGRVVDGLSSELLEGQGAIWLNVLAYAVLGQAERQRWRELGDAPGKRRCEWLRGRIAAKDAVREVVADERGVRLCPADVEIRVADRGRPEAVVPAKAGGPFSVTIAHAAAMAAALAGPAASGSAGVDVEPVGALPAEVRRAAFGAREAELLAELPEDDSWPVRLWCVKEAAGKASAFGLDGDPRSVEVLRVDPQTGAAFVALADGGHLQVRTAVDGDMAYAACVKRTKQEGAA